MCYSDQEEDLRVVLKQSFEEKSILPHHKRIKTFSSQDDEKNKYLAAAGFYLKDGSKYHTKPVHIASFANQDQPKEEESKNDKQEKLEELKKQVFNSEEEFWWHAIHRIELKIKAFNNAKSFAKKYNLIEDFLSLKNKDGYTQLHIAVVNYECGIFRQFLCLVKVFLC